MTVTRRVVVAAATVPGALLVPRLASAAPDPVKGSGMAATQHRDVGPFTGVALGAPFAVILRSGSREGIDIVADDNLMRFIETSLRVRGSERTLRIDVVPGTRIDPTTPIVITLAVVRLDAIALGSSGSVAATGLTFDHLAASIGGSGEIRLSAIQVADLDLSIGGSGRFVADGRAGKLTVSIAGSGRCDAERLIAGDVAVSVAGSGTATVHADNAIDASIAGSGDVLYRGNATPRATIVGSGRLKRL